jgi:hypothetical protein
VAKLPHRPLTMCVVSRLSVRRPADQPVVIGPSKEDPMQQAKRYLELRKRFLSPLHQRETRFNDTLAVSITNIVGTMFRSGQVIR